MYFLVLESSNFHTDMIKDIKMNTNEITTQKMELQESTEQNEAYDKNTSKLCFQVKSAPAEDSPYGVNPQNIDPQQDEPLSFLKLAP